MPQNLPKSGDESVGAQTSAVGIGPWGNATAISQQVVSGKELSRFMSRKFWLTTGYLVSTFVLGITYILVPKIKEVHPELSDLLSQARIVLMAYLGIEGAIDGGGSIIRSWRR